MSERVSDFVVVISIVSLSLYLSSHTKLERFSKLRIETMQNVELLLLFSIGNETRDDTVNIRQMR